MKTPGTKFISVTAIFLMAPVLSHADVINFSFTGGIVVTAPRDSNYTSVPTGSNTAIISSASGFGDGSVVMPISATLTYDTVSGFGSSGLSVTPIGNFFGYPLVFHDISMTRQTGSNLITGQVLVDWGNYQNMQMNVEWDATGLLNAINYGLQAGDIISGTNLYRDSNGNGVGDPAELLTNVFSATPYSDILQTQLGYNWLQGPAPIAATSGSMGLDGTTPFPGYRGFIDIGSGNSMHVVSVTAVPIPAAVWLLGSGLAGLLAAARRRKAT